MEWFKVFESVEEAVSILTENKPQLLLIAGKRITLVMRNGLFSAFDDSCPHNAQSLSKGTVNFAGEIVCPLHAYRFSMKTGREADERCRDLRIFFTKSDDTGFYVAL